MKKLTLSNGVEITAHIGDGDGGGSGIYLYQKGESKDRYPIPKKDLPKVIKLLAWYEKEELKLHHWEGGVYGWGETPMLEDTLHSPYHVAYYRGKLEAAMGKKF